MIHPARLGLKQSLGKALLTMINCQYAFLEK
jgi:hypothetical protein